ESPEEGTEERGGGTRLPVGFEHARGFGSQPNVACGEKVPGKLCRIVQDIDGREAPVAQLFVRIRPVYIVRHVGALGLDVRSLNGGHRGDGVGRWTFRTWHGDFRCRFQRLIVRMRGGLCWLLSGWRL